MNRVVFSCVALVALTSVAQSADLPVQAYKAPVVVPSYNWTGFYIGVNGGYGWGKQDPLNLITDRFDKFAFSVSGGMFGGTVGAQIQAAHVVMGLEADLDWANIRGSSTVVPTILGLPVGATVRMASNTEWLGTARVRVGYAQDNWLFYGTGGAALLSSQANGNSVAGITCGTAGVLQCTGSGVRPGIAAGAGIEYGFTPNWSAKFEYLWIGAVGGKGATESFSTVRAGVNYRLGGV